MKINTILATIKECIAAGAVPYNELPMSAQMRVLNSKMYSVHSNIEFWTERLEDENAPVQLRKRAALELNGRDVMTHKDSSKSASTKVHIPGLLDIQNSILPHIKAAAHYAGGAEGEVMFDSGYVDELGAISGDVEYSTVATTGHPYAWVMTSLTERLGIDFSNVIASTETPLILDNVEKVYAKAAATYIAQCILIEAGKFTPASGSRSQYESDTIMLAANSTTLAQIAKLPTAQAQERAILAMLKVFEARPLSQNQYVDGVLEKISYTYTNLLSIWKELELQDQEQREAEAAAKADAEASAELKAMQRDIASAVRDVIKSVSIANTLAQATASMQKAKVPQDTIADVIGRLSTVLNPSESATKH